jgi:hypothetical protein
MYPRVDVGLVEIKCLRRERIHTHSEDTGCRRARIGFSPLARIAAARREFQRATTIQQP